MLSLENAKRHGSCSYWRIITSRLHLRNGTCRRWRLPNKSTQPLNFGWYSSCLTTNTFSGHATTIYTRGLLSTVGRACLIACCRVLLPKQGLTPCRSLLREHEFANSYEQIETRPLRFHSCLYNGIDEVLFSIFLSSIGDQEVGTVIPTSCQAGTFALLVSSLPKGIIKGPRTTSLN